MRYQVSRLTLVPFYIVQLLLLRMCMVMPVYAQLPKNGGSSISTIGLAIKPLTIGDTVPDVMLENIIDHPTGTARLSDFRGKVLILDFWATWCTSCIKGFPKLDSLRKVYMGSLDVVLVNAKQTRDTPEKVRLFLSRFQRQFPGFALPSTVEDSIMTGYFPFRLLPHYVWLDGSRRVLAITGSEAITRENINAFLYGKQPDLALKKDVLDYKAEKPLLIDNNGGDDSALVFRSLFSRYLPGLPNGVRKHSTVHVRKTTFLNHTVLQLYHAASGLAANRLILEVSDSSRIVPNQGVAPGWKENAYCYEITVPVKTTKDEQNRMMLRDLNQHLELDGRLEVRSIDCWVLTVKDVSKLPAGNMNEDVHDASAVRIRNQPLTVLTNMLNSQVVGTANRPVVLNETAYDGRVNLNLRASFDDLEGLSRELKQYGLALSRERRDVPFLIIKNSCEK